MLGLYRRSRGIEAVMMTASFNTHSFSMNQRTMVLKATSVVQLSLIAYKIEVNGPKTIYGKLGYYI